MFEIYFPFPEEYGFRTRMIAFFWEKAPGMVRASSDFPAKLAQESKFMRGFETFQYISE